MSTPTRHAFTVEEWEQLGAAGLFADTRVELIQGEIIEMSPIGSRHAMVVDLLTRLLVRGVGDRALVRVQNPVRLDGRSEPQPDLALLRPPFARYYHRHPGPDDILLVVEVADTTLGFDRAVKMPLYAGAGVAEAWLVDVDARRLYRHVMPGPGGYGDVASYGTDAVVEPAALPGVAVTLAGIFAG